MAFAPASLDAIVPGSIGIIGDARSAALDRMTTIIRFEEEPAGMPFADDAGGLDEMSAPAGTIAPTKAPGAIGRAAVFVAGAGGNTALQGKDIRVGGTLLPRDLTVQTMIAWDLTAQDALHTTGTIIARGLGTGAIEYMPFALEVNVINAAARIGEVRWLWHTSAGVLKTQTGASFVCPTAGTFFLLTATRRWVSPTSAVVRYYANDQLLGEVATVDGDIAAAVDGTTTIGARFAAGVYGNFLTGALDELAIFNFEMCREEIEATWLRMSLYQPDGYRQMGDLMPPGIRISNDPNSQIQSDLRSMGLGLGLADAQIENVRANMMPDRAYGNVLRRWEAITRQAAMPGDSIDTRRARVVGQLSTRLGVSVPGVETALAKLLGLPIASLPVFAFDNTIRDLFNTIEPLLWNVTAGWDAIAQHARVQAAAGTYTWDQANIGLSMLTAVAAPRASTTRPNPLGAVSMFALVDPQLLPANAEAGIVLRDWARGDLFFFGVRNTGGVFQVGYQRFEGYVAIDAAFTAIAATALTKHWLRVRPGTNPVDDPTSTEQKYSLSYSTVSGEEADLVTIADLTFRKNFGWAGFYLRTNGAIGSAADVRFDGSAFALRNANGTRPFYWYVFRDPGLGGTYDIVGANRVVQRMRHGFTKAAAITSKSFLCDSAGSLCDRDPLGCL